MGAFAPAGYLVRGGRGVGQSPIVTWFGYLNPDVTTSPTYGLYLVYLFSADLTRVVLSVNQGCTKLSAEIGDAKARAQLVREAVAIRAELPRDVLTDTLATISLGSRASMPRLYEAANVAGFEYSLADLPPEGVLRSDLARFFDLYDLAVEAKRAVLLAEPGTIQSGGQPEPSPKDPNPLRGFKPKSAEDYRQYIEGREITKTRRHEALLTEFAVWAKGEGYEVHSPHPCDCVLVKHDTTWLVEAKVIRNGNVAHAVREAIGQLFDYRYFLYTASSRPSPTLVALFSEDIGLGYVELLSALDIDCLSPHANGTWYWRHSHSPSDS